MKKIISWLFASTLLAMGAACSDSDDTSDLEVVTKPVVKFMENPDDPNLVKAVITSDIDLKQIVVSTVCGENTETVATISTFSDPKSYTYENRFVVPNGFLEMTVRIEAMNMRDLTTAVETRLKGEVTISMTDVIDAMSAAYKEWEGSGAMPEEVAINGFTFAKTDYFEYAARTYLNLYNNVTDDPVIVGGYGDAEDNERPDTFEQEEISPNFLNDAMTRTLNYAANNGHYPNYTSYGSAALAPYEDPDGVPYEGLFTFRRAVVCVARMLDYYKTNGALGTISSEYRIIEAYKPASAGTFTQEALIDALAAAYASWQSDGAMPEEIAVGDAALNRVQYFHAAIELLLRAAANDGSDIEVLTYMLPENPARDSYDRETVLLFNGPENGSHTEDLANVAQRMLNYASNPKAGNGYFSNYASYERPEVAADAYVEFSLDRAVVCLARAIAARKSDGKWPESVATEYLKPTAATLKDFAREAVGMLDVWEKTRGEIQVTDGDKFEDVRYVPADFKITVAGTEYNKSAIFEIAGSGFMAMMQENGTLADPIPTPHFYNWSANPYNEGMGNGGPLTPEEASMELLLNYFPRQTKWAAGHDGQWSNFCGYGGGQVAGYGGVLCLERALLTYVRFYKHLLDNGIEDHVAEACADVKIDATLY